MAEQTSFLSLAIKLAVLVGIAVHYPMTVHYGVRAFAGPAPEYTDFMERVPAPPTGCSGQRCQGRRPM